MKKGGINFGQCIIGLLLFVIVGLLWTSTQLALQPSCQAELDRAVQAEQALLSRRAETEELIQLRRRVAELEVQLAQANVRGSSGLQVGLSGNTATLTDSKQQLEHLKMDNAVLKGYEQGASTASDVTIARAPALRGTGGKITEDSLRSLAGAGAIGVAVIVCKRPQYLTRAMDSFTKARYDSEMFPIVISQDADDAAMNNLVESKYVNTGIAFHVRHTHESNARQVAAKFGGGAQALGYVLIAQHFRFALRKMMDDFLFEQVIFLEEDLEISPDFFAYFKASLPILKNDPSLYCVSAWNDNGDASLVKDPKALYRTEVFPGLGWMVDKSFWNEVRNRWPDAYWDEFMRRGDIRNGRSCIRPEISRSYTFGEEGTSGNQFGSHLARIKLNSENVDWAREDLAYLSSKEAYESWQTSMLHSAETVSAASIDRYSNRGSTLKIEYDDKREWRALSQRFRLMPDEKEGMRRMSYRGVVPFAWQGNRVLLYTRHWPGGL